MNHTMHGWLMACAVATYLVLLAGTGAAVPLDDDGYFDVGVFRQHETGGIEGTCDLSGLQGCSIGVYTADGSHLLDISYQVDHIDIALQVLEDSVLNKLLEKEEWLEQYMRDIAFQRLSFEQPEIRFSYDNCTIEMHDSSITFLKIYTTGAIVFSGLSDYTLNQTSPSILEISRGDFSGTIFGCQPITVDNGVVTAQRVVMFRGVNEPFSAEMDKIQTVEGAIKAGMLGGEITVVRDGEAYRTDAVSYYNNVTIRNKTLTDDRAEFVVSGDHHTTGKTVKINIGKNALSSRDLRVLFDGESMPMADDLTDVFNPNDDGLQPEYVMVNVTAGGGDEFFLLVSVPHFSEHTITLQSVVKNPIFVGVAAVGALATIMVASWAMFRRRP